MKILLIGDFSGFFSTLKHSLKTLGHDVTLVSNYNSLVNFPEDFSLIPQNLKSKKIIDLYRYLLPPRNLNKLFGFDVVQFINPAILSPINPFNGIIGRQIIKNSHKSFLSAAGDDAFYSDSKNFLRYNPLEAASAFDYNGFKLSIDYAWFREWNSEIVSLVDGVIPVMFDYAQAYRLKKVNNLRPSIPLPIDVKKIKYVGCGTNKKIRVLHGLSRPGYKGTPYIRAAFEILKYKYKGSIDFIIQENLPANKYIESLTNIDIIVDQVNSYSSGMNGLIGLALGKVVLGGSEPESLEEFSLNNSPIVNITPNVNDIVSKLSAIIKENDLKNRGVLSRNYVQDNHDSINIAKRYLEEWSK
jgi:hypothetical protein